MKVICYALCALLLFITACSKNDDQYAGITGKWDWVSTDGGLIGIHETPASTGKNTILQFTSDKKFYVSTNGILTYQGTFLIRKADRNGTPVRYIDFSNGGSQIIAILTLSTLQLGENANDMFASTYKRK